MASSVYDGYWVDYDHIGLSAETTAQIGDALVLMGEEKYDTGEPIVTYGRITNVYNQATHKIILYETTTYDKIIGDSQDYYAKQDLDYDDIVQEAIDAGIPEQLESQAIDSGFAESAMQYLAETAMQTQSITDMMQTSAFGANVDITLPSFPDDWEPNIIIPPVLLDGWSVKAKISTDTDHFGDGGLMCQLYLNGKIEIGRAHV